MKALFSKRCLKCVAGGKLTLTPDPLLCLFMWEIEFSSATAKCHLCMEDISSLLPKSKSAFRNSHILKLPGEFICQFLLCQCYIQYVHFTCSHVNRNDST